MMWPKEVQKLEEAFHALVTAYYEAMTQELCVWCTECGKENCKPIRIATGSVIPILCEHGHKSLTVDRYVNVLLPERVNQMNIAIHEAQCFSGQSTKSVLWSDQ